MKTLAISITLMLIVPCVTAAQWQSSFTPATSLKSYIFNLLQVVDQKINNPLVQCVTVFI